MKNDKEKCPVCGNEEYERISIGGGSCDSTVRIDRAGSVDIICCTNCGVLRVAQDSLNFRKLKDE